jgi:hypothetical protein
LGADVGNKEDGFVGAGNSGGPLLDSFGRLIGVNTATFTRQGQSVECFGMQILSFVQARPWAAIQSFCFRKLFRYPCVGSDTQVVLNSPYRDLDDMDFENGCGLLAKGFWKVHIGELFSHWVELKLNVGSSAGSGQSSGVNFAIPVDVVYRIVPRLIVYGSLNYENGLKP